MQLNCFVVGRPRQPKGKSILLKRTIPIILEGFILFLKR
ncbi:hypothetical protein NC99_38000 [Sunxiuqinia dokdonensis]|uniref:Uncharacterized protein n=1 Tax=Sunxiuqinia dokdonensis TaxID=1409788 RepID=A0A0L8V4T5_9BACT|nr:hypothetical protein NC99_38000 [Sunxiuqinia dokdonensis]